MMTTGSSPGVTSDFAKEALDGWVALEVHPLVGDATAREELADRQRLGREPRPHDTDGSSDAAQEH